MKYIAKSFSFKLIQLIFILLFSLISCKQKNKNHKISKNKITKYVMDDIVNEAQRSPLNGKSKLEICFYDFNGKRKKIQKNDSCLVKVKFFSPHFKQMNVNQKIRLEKSLYVNYDLKYWNNQYMIVTNDKSDTIAFQIYIYAKNVKFIDFDGKEYNSIPLCLNYFFPKDFKKN